MSDSPLVEYLDRLTEFCRRTERENWRFSSYEQFFRELGRPWPVPAEDLAEEYGVERGEMKQCFANSTLAVVNNIAGRVGFEDDALVYVEGYAIGAALIPVHHAWVVTPNGEVIDPTWTEGHEYFGIPFNRRWYLDLVVETNYYGVLGNGDYAMIAKLMREGLPLEAIHKMGATV